LQALPVGAGTTLGDVAAGVVRDVRATISRGNGTPSATVCGEILGDASGAVSAAGTPACGRSS
jgi:hypothetical protein